MLILFLEFSPSGRSFTVFFPVIILMFAKRFHFTHTFVLDGDFFNDQPVKSILCQEFLKALLKEPI
jgi:hypothetical protein